ncbi:MAG: tetratricopeptide repeat protein [Planctomycetota bacterium]
MTIETSSKKSPTQNDAFDKSNDYQKALELAEAGKHEEALECINEYLNSSPNDAEALNDVGAILHCLDRSDEAVKYLVKARNLQPDSAEIIWNLSETYLAGGKAAKAIELFDDMDRMGILNADLFNRTAEVLLNEDNLVDALEMLHRSLKLSPDQEILKPMIEVIRSRMAENNCE